MGIYAQFLGVAFGLSRIKDLHNSLGLHMLASFACMMAISSTTANIAQFYQSCHGKFEDVCAEAEADIDDCVVKTGPTGYVHHIVVPLCSAFIAVHIAIL